MIVRLLEYLLSRARGPRNYIILHQIYPAPIDTGTAWCAYEAAPQFASSPEDAARNFARDSGLHGIFLPVLQDEFSTVYSGVSR